MGGVAGFSFNLGTYKCQQAGTKADPVPCTAMEVLLITLRDGIRGPSCGSNILGCHSLAAVSHKPAVLLSAL